MCYVQLKTLAAWVDESEEWAAIVSSAEDNRESYCKALLTPGLQHRGL
jgi:hypothetical protein